MVISEDVLREIEAKVKQYDDAKANIKAKIGNNIDDAVKKLYSTKNELFDEAEREFAANPFADFLSNKDKHTDEDARMFLNEQKIPENFGPDENSLSTLLKDIDSFRAWRDKPRPLDLVSKDLEAKNVTYDSISLSWTATSSDCIYKIELKSPTSLRTTHYTDKLEHAFYNLRPGTEYHIRVRAVFLRRDVKCMWSDPITVKTKNIFARDVTVKVASWYEMEVSWEVYDEEEESNNDIRYTVEMRKEGERHWNEVKSGLVDKTSRVGGLMDDSAYEIRVRCVVKGGSLASEWSDVARGRTQKIPVPSGITAKGTAWDTIALTWGNVSDASFYRIEVDGSNFLESSTTNALIKRGLLPDTEYSFRVCTVSGNVISEWSGVVKGRTLKAAEFPECVWKECPEGVDEEMKYIVNEENPRIATKVNSIFDNYYCTTIGNTCIPPNSVTSWSIKILKSEDNDGNDIYIGVTPSDINQHNCNYAKCGWYLSCYYSTLYSGPPHNYIGKAYGPRKNKGQYVHTGDSVGVVIDTVKGELSFVLSNVNHGIAYEGIPLDEPLAPCVLLKNDGDSVELDTSSVKENKVDGSIFVPSNIIAMSTTWDTITLTWDEIEDASFYQVEVDGNRSWDAPTTNKFTKGGFLPTTKHSFRVRAIRGNSMSEWSGIAKGKTLSTPEFSECAWKKCPDDINDNKKYDSDGRDPRIATKINSDYDDCTIIGNTPILPSKTTSWGIKILESKDNNGYGIYIGVAPSDINQNDDNNYRNCGWYFDCYWSELCSGPPHNYIDKEYGPQKEKNGQYVHNGDIVGVVMDTKKGELSFVLNRANRGVAYKGVPLDKPLVPCVILVCQGDSVKLDTFGLQNSMIFWQ